MNIVILILKILYDNVNCQGLVYLKGREAQTKVNLNSKAS